MQRRQISIPELVAVATTRAALGAGVGLLLADRLKATHRRRTGIVLTSLGVLSTVPLLLRIFGDHRRARLLTTDEGWDPDSVRRAAHEPPLPGVVQRH